MNAVRETVFVDGLSWLCPVLAVLMLAGCTVGPNYVPPKTSTPATWHAPMEDGLIVGEADPQTLASWWVALDDPQLSRLMERAVAGSLDLKKARVADSRGEGPPDHRRGGRFPTLDAAGLCRLEPHRRVRRGQQEQRILRFELRCRLGNWISLAAPVAPSRRPRQVCRPAKKTCGTCLSLCWRRRP